MRAVFLCALSLILGMSVTTLFGAENDMKPTDELTVMSFNIRYGKANDGENRWDNRKEFVAETIQEVSPDLLGLQECLPFQRDFLIKHLPGYAVHAAGREDGKEQGEMCAIFYRKDRFELLDSGHFWLSETPDVAGSKSWDSSLPRMASWVLLVDKKSENKKPILYGNTHFDHKGQIARVESAKMIRERAAKHSEFDIIVTGDFNAGEGSKPYQAMFGEIDGAKSPVIDSYRAFVPEKKEEEGTFNGFNLSKNNGDRIDWIGVSADWKVEDAQILHNNRDGRTPSDHFPITAKLAR
ncbi:endonuclease [Bremerella cremea]|uniref:Endonuclease n=1 Tax=Bremerella cremea TaxID=1031537 RepID=A0A368KLW8_9BACT|nr:endonuclease/exonuclease/phosphatase family protein [Bremerella cremea]RCS42169.1 endonuclease [Bremerella cremea]